MDLLFLLQNHISRALMQRVFFFPRFQKLFYGPFFFSHLENDYFFFKAKNEHPFTQTEDVTLHLCVFVHATPFNDKILLVQWPAFQLNSLRLLLLNDKS